MSALQEVTQWFEKGTTKTAATYTYGPFNAEDLNSCQFFLKYTGAVNTTVNIRVSPADAYGFTISPDGYDVFSDSALYEESTVLASGDNSAEGFFNPATAMDRPFKSFYISFVVAAQITGCYFAICRAGVGS
jgi:hypothetical protein